MRVLRHPQDREKIERLFARRARPDPATEKQVRAIIERVRREGDRAVADLTKRFDGVALKPNQFHVPLERLKAAWEGLPRDLQKALRLAHTRIAAYHKRQLLKGFTYRDALGNRMDQRVMALRRVCVCVPGWTASYPSTLLMDTVPARIAGVDEIVLFTRPSRLGEEGGRATLGAAWLAGVDEVIAVGGTPGIAALALGTETIRPVDKIVGPGNRFVSMAKRLLYGEIDIDMIAGPSEVLILADETAPPRLVAADLLSQAEHDPDAQAVAILIGGCDPAAIQRETARQAAAAPRREIIRKSLARNGALILVRSRDEAIELAERKAPEHLEVLTRNPRALAGRIRSVGAIFLGPFTPEPIGDYVAGPNHTLPTGGTARFFSPLSVWSFLKTSHVVECSRRGFLALAGAVETLARAEGLFAHAEAARIRGKAAEAAR